MRTNNNSIATIISTFEVKCRKNEETGSRSRSFIGNLAGKERVTYQEALNNFCSSMTQRFIKNNHLDEELKRDPQKKSSKPVMDDDPSETEDMTDMLNTSSSSLSPNDRFFENPVEYCSSPLEKSSASIGRQYAAQLPCIPELSSPGRVKLYDHVDIPDDASWLEEVVQSMKANKMDENADPEVVDTPPYDDSHRALLLSWSEQRRQIMRLRRQHDQDASPKSSHSLIEERSKAFQK
jgi:hypothetical protein